MRRQIERKVFDKTRGSAAEIFPPKKHESKDHQSLEKQFNVVQTKSKAFMESKRDFPTQVCPSYLLSKQPRFFIGLTSFSLLIFLACIVSYRTIAWGNIFFSAYEAKLLNARWRSMANGPSNDTVTFYEEFEYFAENRSRSLFKINIMWIPLCVSDIGKLVPSDFLDTLIDKAILRPPFLLQNIITRKISVENYLPSNHESMEIVFRICRSPGNMKDLQTSQKHSLLNSVYDYITEKEEGKSSRFSWNDYFVIHSTFGTSITADPEKRFPSSLAVSTQNIAMIQVPAKDNFNFSVPPREARRSWKNTVQSLYSIWFSAPSERFRGLEAKYLLNFFSVSDTGLTFSWNTSEFKDKYLLRSLETFSDLCDISYVFGNFDCENIRKILSLKKADDFTLLQNGRYKSINHFLSKNKIYATLQQLEQRFTGEIAIERCPAIPFHFGFIVSPNEDFRLYFKNFRRSAFISKWGSLSFLENAGNMSKGIDKAFLEDIFNFWAAHTRFALGFAAKDMSAYWERLNRTDMKVIQDEKISIHSSEVGEVQVPVPGPVYFSIQIPVTPDIITAWEKSLLLRETIWNHVTKGLENLVTAVEIIKSDFTRPLSSELKSLITRSVEVYGDLLKMLENTKFLDRLSRESREAFLLSCDVLFNESFEQRRRNFAFYPVHLTIFFFLVGLFLMLFVK